MVRHDLSGRYIEGSKPHTLTTTLTTMRTIASALVLIDSNWIELVFSISTLQIRDALGSATAS